MEVDELTHLVSELVELATDRSGDAEPIETVDLATLAGEVVEPGPPADRSGDHAHGDGSGRRRSARPRRSPARSRTSSTTRASTATGRSTSWSTVDRLEVRDRGPGIPDADRPHVFDRFYRSMTARTGPDRDWDCRSSQQAVDRHGGRVWATDRTDPDPDGHLGAAVGFSL